jgi:hypothetical protein
MATPVIGSILAVLAIAAAFGLVRRRRWSIIVAWAWSLARLAWSIVTIAAIFNLLAYNRGAPLTRDERIVALISPTWALFVALLVVVWLLRPAIRRQPRTWG